jgi:biopolymer transport protein ExbD
MLTLPALRHSFFAAWAAPLITLLACLMPIVPFCQPLMPLVPHLAGEKPWIGSERDLVLSVRYDGTLLVGQEYVRPECLDAALHEVFLRGRERRRVILQVDRRSPFRSTRDVVSALGRAGIQRVILASGTRSVAD